VVAVLPVVAVELAEATGTDDTVDLAFAIVGLAAAGTRSFVEGAIEMGFFLIGAAVIIGRCLVEVALEVALSTFGAGLFGPSFSLGGAGAGMGAGMGTRRGPVVTGIDPEAVVEGFPELSWSRLAPVEEEAAPATRDRVLDCERTGGTGRFWSCVEAILTGPVVEVVGATVLCVIVL
jgi:hypothetical protein